MIFEAPQQEPEATFKGRKSNFTQKSCKSIINYQFLKDYHRHLDTFTIIMAKRNAGHVVCSYDQSTDAENT